MAEVARQHEQAFVTAGIRPDFIDRLIAATDAVRDSESAKSQIVALRVEATAGLHRQIREARRYLRALDGFVRAALKAEDGLLARWTHLSRVVPKPEAEFTEVIGPSQPATSPAGPNAGSPSSERDDALAGRRAESPLNAAA
jgi:hypothetical protein